MQPGSEETVMAENLSPPWPCRALPTPLAQCGQSWQLASLLEPLFGPYSGLPPACLTFPSCCPVHPST